MNKKSYLGFVFFIFVAFSVSSLFSSSVKAETETLQFGTQVTGSITEDNPSQTYEITLEKPGIINIDFASYIYEVRLDVYDSYGNEVFDTQYISSGSSTNPKQWFGSEYLEAGTYYIKVSQYYDYTGTYNLKVNYEPTNNNELEPNNGTEQAQILGLNQSVTGLISWSDSQDFYKIDMKKAGKININFSSYIYEVRFDIYDSYGTKVFDTQYIYEGSLTNPKKWSQELELKEGIYYIKISKYNVNTGKYVLSITNPVHFTDVVKGAYYYDAVIELSSSGIISGYPDGTFRPNQALSRAHAIILLTRALNLKVPENYKEIADKFSDVGRNHIYAKEVAAVYNAGIFVGNNGKMGLNDRLTREQMASVIVRAFNLKDNPAKNGLDGVRDAHLISNSHKKNVEIFYELGITSGKADGRYSPRETVTRGQFATFLNRALKLE